MPVIEYLKPKKLHRPRGYVHITVSEGKAVHVGGQVAVDIDHVVQHAGDYAAQAELATRNLVWAVEGAGGTVADIALINIYIVGLNPESNDQVFEGFGRAAVELGLRVPAVVGLGIAQIAVEGAVVEMDAVAYI